jgi:hypothetical protein
LVVVRVTVGHCSLIQSFPEVWAADCSRTESCGILQKLFQFWDQTDQTCELKHVATSCFKPPKLLGEQHDFNRQVRQVVAQWLSGSLSLDQETLSGSTGSLVLATWQLDISIIIV